MSSPIIKMEVVDLERLVELKKRHAALTAELGEVEREMNEMLEVLGLSRVESAAESPETEARRRKRRGTIKGKLMQLLQESPGVEMHISDIAAKTGLSRKDLDKFLYSRAARETQGLVRVGHGVFKYVVPDVTAPRATRPNTLRKREVQPGTTAAH